MIAFKKWMGLSNLLASSGGEVSIDHDEQWLILAKKGDRSAYEKLLKKYYGTIYQVAYRFTGHSADAEDVTQDVCEKLASTIHAYRGEAQFKTWLYTIIVHTCLDIHRKHNCQQAQLNNYLAFEVLNRAVNHDNGLQVAWLYRELAKLKEPFKETAFLVLAEDLSHAEASRIMGCSESTVSWRMHEIRGKLKALVEGGYEG